MVQFVEPVISLVPKTYQAVYEVGHSCFHRRCRIEVEVIASFFSFLSTNTDRSTSQAPSETVCSCWLFLSQNVMISFEDGIQKVFSELRVLRLIDSKYVKR